MTKKQQDYLQSMEKFTKEYDSFCKKHVCESCQIFEEHKQTGLSCFKIFMQIFYKDFNLNIPID